MSFSNYTEDMLLKALFYQIVYSPPDMYVALWIGNPEEDGLGGTEVSAVGGSGYARVNAYGPSWALASGGIVTNALPITFAEAIVDWGAVTHFAIFDALTAGNMILYGMLTISPLPIVMGSIPRFAPDTLVVQLD